MMDRAIMIQEMQAQSQWDVCIIGGGATGLGAAVDAAARGLRTILFEQYDFAKGTSSRSTKLVHGGVRYLQQGNIRLVMEALKERGLLLRNAPHLVHNQKFVVPNYKWWEGPFYGIGLKIYDWMAGRLGLGPSVFLSREKTLELTPTLDPEGLRGSVVYHDGQFDDARLAISLAQTARQQQAVILNYCPVVSLLKTKGKITGVAVRDAITGNTYEVNSRVVINATGVFSDALLRLDNPQHENQLALSQGIHLVVDREFLAGDTAIMIPRTDDGRVLFAVPWHNKVVLGTTDTPVTEALPEPIAQPAEIDFILTHIGRYLTRDPQRSDVRSVFAGLRPLVKAKGKTTSALSRDHLISTADSGLISIIGGKWTTYRHMAEQVIDTAAREAGLTVAPTPTRTLQLAGHNEPPPDVLALDERTIEKSIRTEACLTVEDMLARRSRMLLLDARKAMAETPRVAATMARILRYDGEWEQQQINAFTQTAQQYILN